MKLNEYPRENELVVVKIRRIMDYGALAELLEYFKKEGFIHKSNVASSWIKNIHSFLSEGDMRVAQVLRIDSSKKTIDLSLRKVSEQLEKNKLEDWKREKRADKLFEIFCKEQKEDFQTMYRKLVPGFIDDFGDFLSAFENASLYGEQPFKKYGLPQKFLDAFVAFAKENVSIAQVSIKGDLELSCFAGNGIVKIKETLKKIERPNLKIEYISAPKYHIEITAQDYDAAEKLLKEVVETALQSMKQCGGHCAFKKV
jgi:translation initiation factor 2 subunit 1